MKKVFALIIAIAPLFSFGQTQTENYIKSTSYSVPVQEGQQSTVSDDNKTESVTYYDGIGRPKQSIAVKQGGNAESVIMHYAYDYSGRRTKSYMPYATDGTVTNHQEMHADALIKTHTFYNTSKYENTTNPYSETKFERSSLGRPIEMAAQGNDWSINSAHTVKLDYGTNDLEEVKRFSVNYTDASKEQTELVYDGYYNKTELYKSIVKGENWVENADPNVINKDHTSESFTDKFGRTVLTRAYNNNEAHDTYYVYDDFGNLTYVIPPLASDQIVEIGEQGYKVSSQVNYPWTQLVQVDKSFASDYNKRLEDYENANILNADLQNEYNGQGGFTVTTLNDSELVTLSISFSANQDLELRKGSIVSLKPYGNFKDTELGRLKGDGYDYTFIIKSNTIVVTGEGKLSSINQTFSSDIKLNYSKNYPWTTYMDVDSRFSGSYEEQLSAYENSEILTVSLPNEHNGQGGLNVTIDDNDNIALTFNSNTSTPFKLKQGIILRLESERSLENRTIGSISGTGFNYTFTLEDNNILVNGEGNVTAFNGYQFASPPPPPPTISPEALQGLSYIYHYDNRNRVVEMKVPGKGWQHLVYDKLNRPILTQDAKQRLDDEWLFIKYDKFSRPIYTGVYTYNFSGTGDNAARIALQTAVNTQQNPVWYETKETTNSNLGIVYTNTVFPFDATNIELLTINFYDNYDGFNEPSIQVFPNAQIFGQAITSNTTSLATASKVKVLETNAWTSYITYYDEKARPIYAASKNEYLNTVDVVKNELDFAGKVLRGEKTHTKGTNSPIITNEIYTYDHAQRLITQTQSINGSAPELITKNSYDELGCAENKKVGGVANSTPENSNGLQTVDYSFNVRGWLKSINEGNTNNGDVFGFKLNYNNTELTGATALFNGNISETHFVSAGDNKMRSYDYKYDALSRLKKATYHGNHAITGLNVNEDYSLKNVSYDKNGNITALERMGLYGVSTGNAQGVDLIDDLTYFYLPQSNQLSSINDTATAEGFKDANISNDDYQYDINGNTTVDKNKGITSVEYNYLDLPTRVTFHNDTATNPDAGTITYVYDALGTKLQKTVKQANLSTGSSTYYAGNMVYEQSNGQAPITLQFIGHSQGYAEPDGQGGYKYVYQFKDHIGNIRVSYSDLNGNGTIESGTEIIQSKNYYPFGLDHNYGTNSPMSVINGRNHKFKYNGQEHDESFGLNVTEMTFRQFDMATGRFNGIDKLAAATYSMTPYHFSGNNPVAYSDPTGLKREYFNGEGGTPYSNLGNDFSSYGAYDFNTHWSETMGFGGVFGALSQAGGAAALVSSLWNLSPTDSGPNQLGATTLWTNNGDGFSSSIGTLSLSGVWQSSIKWEWEWSATNGEAESYTQGNLGGTLGGVTFTGKKRNSKVVDTFRDIETGLSIAGDIGDAFEFTGILALDYRNSLSTLEKVGKNKNLSLLRYSRYASTFMGRLGTAGAIVTSSTSTYDYSQGDISGGELTYKYSSIAAPMVVGAEFGAAPGLAVGAFISLLEGVYYSMDAAYEETKRNLNFNFTTRNIHQGFSMFY